MISLCGTLAALTMQWALLASCCCSSHFFREARCLKGQQSKVERIWLWFQKLATQVPSKKNAIHGEKPYPVWTTGFRACCNHCNNFGSIYVVTWPITDFCLGNPTPSPISDTMLIKRAFRLGESWWPSSPGKARMATGNQRLVELAGVEGVECQINFILLRNQLLVMVMAESLHIHCGTHGANQSAKTHDPRTCWKLEVWLAIPNETTSTSTPGIYDGAANGEHVGMARNNVTNHVSYMLQCSDLVEHPSFLGSAQKAEQCTTTWTHSRRMGMIQK